MAEPSAPGQGNEEHNTDDQKALGNLVNSAVTSQLKRLLGPAVAEALKPHVDGFAGIREQLDKLTKGVATPDKSQGGQGQDDVAKRIAELEKQLNGEREARKAEKASAAKEKAFSALRAELTGKVRPEAVDAAAKLLFHAEGAIHIGEDGTVAFRMGDDEHDLATGVKAWAKSPASALFRPAPGYGEKNPGGKAPKRPTGPDGKPLPESPKEREARLADKLKALGG